MRTVADDMLAPPVTVDPATTIQEASAAMLDAGVQAAIVVARGKVRGLVTAEDVSRALAAGYDAAETLVAVIAQSDPPLLRPDEPLAEAHLRMRAGERGVAPVTGPKNEPLGVLVDPEAGLV